MNALKTFNGVIEMAIFVVDTCAEPGQCPWWRRRYGLRCAVNSSRCLIQSALLEVDTRQVEGSLPRVYRFDPFKNLFGLSQLTLAGTAVSFPKQSDTCLLYTSDAADE